VQLVEPGGDLDQPLDQAALLGVGLDQPALLPRLVRFEESARVEEARAARQRQSKKVWKNV
jgi:hypothetical protein